MKKPLCLLLAFALAATLWAGATGCQSKPVAQQRQPGNTTEKTQILLASTIGPIDAGIVSAFEEEFEKKTGIRVRHIGAGTSAALKIAQTGAVDVVMVHARALEEKFVAEGYGTKRYDLMCNDFVIVGPPDDPAGIKGEKTAAAALRKIARSKALFISRGDQSGTNVKELELWQEAGIKPAGDWYRIYEKGAEGNVKTLLYTDEQNAYTVIDRAAYLMLKNQLKLKILLEKDKALMNYISIIPVNPDKFPNVKYREAMKFVNWLTSREGQLLIRDFGKAKYGEPLFYPNSPEGLKLS